MTPFLYPPYPGSASQESIFDHSSPNYTLDNRVVVYNGVVASKNCPSPAPPGTPPPQAGMCDAGFGGYWSYGLGGWVYYDGHDGVDYGISYRPVYAAADADQVVYAGWWDPQNHKVSLGIYVRLHHSNGYNTYYGHMSSVAVQACSPAGCASVPHGDMLGISGTTGNSSGPHLHLTVRGPAGRPVDPYGWKGPGTDPWPYNQPDSLWVAYPALSYYGAKIYPSGPALAYPADAPTGILVDDGSADFVELPDQCWNDIAAAGTQGGDALDIVHTGPDGGLRRRGLRFVLVLDGQETGVVLEGHLGQDVPDVRSAFPPGHVHRILALAEAAAVLEMEVDDPPLQEPEALPA